MHTLVKFISTLAFLSLSLKPSPLEEDVEVAEGDSEAADPESVEVAFQAKEALEKAEAVSLATEVPEKAEEVSRETEEATEEALVADLRGEAAEVEKEEGLKEVVWEAAWGTEVVPEGRVEREVEEVDWAVGEVS